MGGFIALIFAIAIMLVHAWSDGTGAFDGQATFVEPEAPSFHREGSTNGRPVVRTRGFIDAESSIVVTCE